MKILVISDAWTPQVNGVVRTYECLRDEMPGLGHAMHVIGPADFPRRIAMPFYKEIELVLGPERLLARKIRDYAPDTIHIATEGPLGRAARAYCLKHGLPFTSCYHTQFPEYAAKRAAKMSPRLYEPVRKRATKMLRDFHGPSSALMVATGSLEEELKGKGYTMPMRMLARGVYVERFHPGEKTLFADLKKPVALYVGRVAVEKSIEDFLRMDWDGSKVVVGDGPSLAELKQAFPDAVFVGKKFGDELAAHYRSADVFVFPSRTDTFGMVLLEALACGLPVAAYDVTGPRDIVTADFLGCLDDDLGKAARTALRHGNAQERYDHVRQHYSWPAIAAAFVDIIRDSGAVIPR